MRDREETRCCCAKCGPCVGTIYSECNCRHQARGWQNRGAVETEASCLSCFPPTLSSLKPCVCNGAFYRLLAELVLGFLGDCFGFFFHSKAFTVCFCASPTSSLKQRVKSLELCKEPEFKKK